MPPSLLAWTDPRGIADDADIYAIAVGDVYAFAGGEDGDGNSLLYMSSNGGRSWRNITGRLPDDTYRITAIGANPGSSYVYVGTENGDIYSSDDSGASWGTESAGFSGKHIYAMSFTHKDRLWVGAEDGKLKYTDHSTWTDRTTQLGWATGDHIYALCMKSLHDLIRSHGLSFFVSF